ncbi:DUF72 domain-containing protein [Stenotrophomonas sp. YIM B06876]|uniref:DUF72 domain-containing protein n=1 Tax=Stenotrophomonas sp. YIM B06876 TaxID=3060211 RepID=UPI002739FCFE|nr:DUF72 domain-containing protein [Stenotrophomonas sp. YIM B06876]
MSAGAGTVRVGCAGWSIASRDSERFGAGSSMLSRYATRFGCVEINSSFYRPHQRKTYQRWSEEVPEDFRFSVKMPKTISHELRLRGTGALVEAFLQGVEGLGTRLGGLLLQLPPSLCFDARQASDFFRVLRRRTDVAVVCEPRHPTWFTPAAAALLQRHGIARTGVDPAPVAEAATPRDAGGWCYWRWHGAPRMYYSDYPDTALGALAKRVMQAQNAGQNPWVIFDNTAAGYAVANALRLQQLLHLPQAQPQ